MMNVPAVREKVCLLLMYSVVMAASQSVQPPITDAPEVFICEPITNIIVCAEIGYDNATFPNFRNQMFQTEANEELLEFGPLIRIMCSNALVHLLCAVYAPFCETDHPEIRIKPCKELCEYVRDGCEDELIQIGLLWPPHLDCNRYPTIEEDPLCFGPRTQEGLLNTKQPPIVGIPTPTDPDVNETVPTLTPSGTTVIVSGPTQTLMSTPSVIPTPVPQPRTPTCRLVSDVKDHKFAGSDDCAVNCSGIYFTDAERNTVAPILILLFAIASVLFTLFTVATFLIDRRRFHYPERPVIFLSFCYLVIALAYVVGSVSKLVGGSFACTEPEDTPIGETESVIFQRLPDGDTTYRSASCVILFVMVYYFQMASAIWWVILTLTWFLAAALKWGEEAVERLWLLYHIVAWSVPAIQVILVLALRLVDGDQLAGVCYPGNFSSVGLGVFVFLPLVVYLILGIVFLLIGFIALLNIRIQLQKDPIKAKKLGRLILRIGVYSLFYTIPNFILILLYVYELSEREEWEDAYASCDGDNCSPQPSFTAFILKYLMVFTIGICSTSWVMSQKTLTAWQKFFCSCGCQTGAYEIPMQVKPRHQTAV